jgi:hypothetical protein
MLRENGRKRRKELQMLRLAWESDPESSRIEKLNPWLGAGGSHL